MVPDPVLFSKQRGIVLIGGDLVMEREYKTGVIAGKEIQVW